MGSSSSLENDSLKADITVEPTVKICVTDKRNGFVWDCPTAPFALHYWHAPHFTVRSCPVDREHGWEFRLLPGEDSATVQCTWPRAACSFRATVELDGPALNILLPGKRLVENRSSEVRQMAICVLPGLGGARTGEEGFLFIPRGCGALCRFDKADERETSLLFHADGGRGLTAPVFGISRGRAGYLGIAAEGEFNTELVVAANRGPDHNLNYAHHRVKIRFHPGDMVDENAEYQLKYIFLTGSDVSYAGMARAYRKYLTESRNYPGLRERKELRPHLAEVTGAATVHVQLAEKRCKTRMTGDGELVVKTTFDQVTQIAKKIKKAGIENALITLVGWNCEGRDGLYPTRFPVENAVGGADAMSRAVETVRSLGFHVGALDNYTDMYHRSPVFDVELSAKQLGGGPWRGGIWPGGQSYVICPQQAADRYARRDMRRLCDLGLHGMLFLDHCPGPGVLRCYDHQHPLTRAEYARQVQNIISAAQSTFGLCRISGCNVFAALHADSCMCPALETTAIDDVEEEWFADEPVPFLPMVLHGLVLLAMEADEDLLRVVQYGAAPVYNVSAGNLGHVLERMAKFWPRYAAELAPLADEFIESQETPADGLVKVCYSNGAEVLVNRTDEPVEISGVAVGPSDFQVKR